MSDRERWIVYPLLLFALVLAVAPKKDPKVLHTRELECEGITVGDANGKKVRIGCSIGSESNPHAPSAGVMVLYGENDKRILTLGPSVTDAGRLAFYNADGEFVFDFAPKTQKIPVPMAQPLPKPTEQPSPETEKNENPPAKSAPGP